MPYNPGVVDQSGALFSAGISQAANAFAGAISGWQQRQDEDKLLTSQAKALETLLPQYAKSAGVADDQIQQFLTPSPDETPRARVARLQAAVEGIIGTQALKTKALQDEQTQTVIAGEKQRQGDLTRQVQDELAQRGRMRTMFGGAPSTQEIGAILQQGGKFQDLAAQTPPADAAGAVRGALANGIEDPRLLAAIGRFADNAPFNPRLVDLGDGVTAMMTSSKSAIPVLKPPSKPVTQSVQVGSKTLTVGPGNRYFDETGAPVTFPLDHVPKAPDIALQATDPELYKALRDDYLNYQQRRSGTSAGPKSTAASATKQFASPEAVRTAVANGTLTREEALQILRTQFKFK